MALANIKLNTQEIEELKKFTQEKTGQKAVEKAVIYYLRDVKQRNVIKTLKKVKINPKFNPLKLRNYER